MPSETIDLRGHIIDSQILQRVLDQIIAAGADYVVEHFDLGHSKKDQSYARVRIESASPAKLHDVVELVDTMDAAARRVAELAAAK